MPARMCPVVGVGGACASGGVGTGLWGALGAAILTLGYLECTADDDEYEEDRCPCGTAYLENMSFGTCTAGYSTNWNDCTTIGGSQWCQCLCNS